MAAATIAGAAQLSGISTSTLERWLRDQEFLNNYGAARRRALDRAVGRLASSLDCAAETLTRNLTCGHRPTEVRCALALFDLAYRDAEWSDVDTRLSMLEGRLAARRAR